MTNAIFLIARLGSTRLPRKALMPVSGRPMIAHLVDRAKRARRADGIVLCTTSLPLDDPLAEAAATEGIACYRGSYEDVIDRCAAAASFHGVDFFVVVEGDEVFAEPAHMDLTIETARATGADLVVVEGLPIGSHVRGIRASAAATVCRLKLDSHSEGWLRPFLDARFAHAKVVVDAGAGDLPVRLTLDYPEDLELIRAVYDRLYAPGETISLQSVLELLRREPALLAINQEQRTGHAERVASFPAFRLREAADTR